MTIRETVKGLRLKKEVIRDLGPKTKAAGIKGGKKKNGGPPPSPTYFPA